MNKNKMVVPALWSNVVLFVLTMIGMAVEAEWYFIIIGIVFWAALVINLITLYKEY
jgi:Zn-dependent membrane protease YugP